MKAWWNSLGINGLVGIVGLLALLHGGVVYAIASVKPAAGSVANSTLPPVTPLRLLAAGSRGRLWLMMPVKPSKPGSGPQFLMLSHAVNVRYGNAGLWRQVSTGNFIGYPGCAVASDHPVDGIMKQGVYLFFPNGTASCFGRKGSVSLPELNGIFSPIAAAGEDGKLYLLVNGTLAAAPATAPSPAQRILRRLSVLESRMMGTTLPATAVPGNGAAAAGAMKSVAGTRPAKNSSVEHKSVESRKSVLISPGKRGASVQDVSTKSRPASASALSVRQWHLLGYHDNRWYLLPTPKLPAQLSNTLPSGGIALMAIKHQLVLFYLLQAHVIRGQVLNLGAKRPVWSMISDITLAQPAHALLAVGLGRRGVLTWTSYGLTGKTSISGARVAIKSGGRLTLDQWPRPLVWATVRSGFADVAMGRDGDCFAILLRQPGRRLTQYTFKPDGQLLQGPEHVIPLRNVTPVSDNYERLVLAALIVIMAFSVWRRKEPLGSPQITPRLQVARLHRRFAAAGIDLAVAALVVMVAFHLYTRRDWVNLAGASLDLLFNPLHLLDSPDFLWLLGIYELHVTIAELIFARSIGKAAIGLYVVDLTGRRPGFVALLTRNVFRSIEIVACIMLVFMFVSPDRQRIGDILAHTVVCQNSANDGKSI